MSTRLNRIPRVPAPRLGLLSTLRRWYYARRLAWLNAEIRDLQHWVALDQTIARAHRINLTDSPALCRRAKQQRSKLAGLIRAQGRYTLALAELELQA